MLVCILKKWILAESIEANTRISNQASSRFGGGGRGGGGLGGLGGGYIKGYIILLQLQCSYGMYLSVWSLVATSCGIYLQECYLNAKNSFTQKLRKQYS